MNQYKICVIVSDDVRGQDEENFYGNSFVASTRIKTLEHF